MVLKLVSYEMIGQFALCNVQKVIYEILIDVMSEFGFECDPSPHQNYKSAFVKTNPNQGFPAHINCQVVYLDSKVVNCVNRWELFLVR